jgi:DNA-repair protein XRCC2
VSCVLPKEWNGVHYGGLGHLVVFLDLDCRFDILRFSEMLKHRIIGESIGKNPCNIPLFFGQNLSLCVAKRVS